MPFRVDHLGAALLRRVRAHVRRGGVIAYPTESCYGLGCDPRNRRAVLKILRLKQRTWQKGLILVGANFTQLRRYVRPLSDEQAARVGATWPGPVTWLLPAAPDTPRWLRGTHRSLAVRVTAHPQTARLCAALGTALVSTSANRAGMKASRTFRNTVRLFGAEVLVLRGMTGGRKHPSKIVDILSGKTIRA